MNLNDSEFEQQLRSMQAHPVSSALEEKIALALESLEIVGAQRVPTAAILRRAERRLPD